MNNVPSIQVVDLTKKYKTNTVLDQVSFTVQPGSVFAFLGPNGAGKSTTMRILSTLLSFNQGSVKVNNHALPLQSFQVRHSYGLVFQSCTLDENLTIYENLMLRAQFCLSKTQAKLRVEECCQQFHLEALLRKKVMECSGGQKRLAQIARSLLHHPSILILDEPTTGLDPRSRQQVWQTLLECRNRGLTLFFSTHYLEEASQADQLCLIDKGKVLVQDSPDHLLELYGKKQMWIQEADRSYTVGIQNPAQARSILNRLQDQCLNFRCTDSSLEDLFFTLTAKAEVL